MDINLSKNLYDIISQAYTLVKENVEFALIGGSFVNPYIRNHRDIDIIFIVKDDDIRKKVIKTLRKNNMFKEFHKYNLGIIVASLTLDINSLYWTYILLYGIELFGTKDIRKNNNILEHKEEWIEGVRKESSHIGYFSKIWYHIYTGLKIIDNNSYDLDEETINNINILHDCEESPFRDSLVNWCIDRLNIET